MSEPSVYFYVPEAEARIRQLERELAEARAQLAKAQESEQYAWKNARTIDAARQEVEAQLAECRKDAAR